MPIEHGDVAAVCFSDGFVGLKKGVMIDFLENSQTWILVGIGFHWSIGQIALAGQLDSQ